MSGIDEVIEVDAPAERAYAIWADFGSYQDWIGGVEEVTRTGDRLHWKAGPGPVTKEWEAVIVAEEPGRRLAWEAPDGPIDTDVRFEALSPERTRVHFRERMHDSLVVEAVAATPFADRQARQDLERFRQRAESGS